MQQKLPCDVCSRAFMEKAIVGYHAWFNGENRTCFKQRMCGRCYGRLYSIHKPYFLSTDTLEEINVDTCGQCGEELRNDEDRTWSTWYRGQDRRDTIIGYCSTHAAELRRVMMEGATRQEERQLEGSGRGAPPFPNPPGFGSRETLPW